jgi:hypothetical protein
MSEYRPKVKHRFDGLYENTFISTEENQPHLDLHYYLAHPTLFPIDTEVLWNSSKMHPYYNDNSIRTLSDEHNLIHLAVHCFKDMSFVNYSLIDAHNLLKSNRLDINEIFKVAKSWNAAGALYLLIDNIRKITFKLKLNEDEKIFKVGVLQRNLGKKIIELNEKHNFIDKSVNYRFMQIMSQWLLSNNKKQVIEHFFFYIKLKKNL